MKLSRRNMLIAGGVAAVPLTTVGVALAEADTADLPTTGTVPDQLAGFDKDMRAYLEKRSVSSAQLAVARKGKLLLARGYGTKVEPDSLFRIASLSKQITAAAVMTLVQKRKLKLGTPVADILGLSESADSRLSKVTILRLLQHLGGWDRDKSGDQLWRDRDIAQTLDTSLPINHTDIIEYTTARKLDFDPGSKMVYSNYGYMLLGRVIEKVSGTGYEEYVKTHVLNPADISRMKLGQSLREDAARTEVEYESKYTDKTVLDGSGKKVPMPYGGFNMPNQDANGGWIASAVDMLRLQRVFDTPDLVLSESSLKSMFAKPETGANSGGSWYGASWQIRNSGNGVNRWHTGSLPGTYSFVARLNNGVSYCAIVNRREEEGTPEFASIDSMLGDATADVESWPSKDLFPEYF